MGIFPFITQDLHVVDRARMSWGMITVRQLYVDRGAPQRTVRGQGVPPCKRKRDRTAQCCLGAWVPPVAPMPYGRLSPWTLDSAQVHHIKSICTSGTLTASTWRELLAHPRDVGQGMRTSIERFGGKVVACYFYGNNPNGFLQFPDDQTANAWAIAYGAQEGVEFGEFFAVFTPTEMTEALRLAECKVGCAEDAR